METRRLGYFVLIADSGSISRAAAKAGLAQPALSQQLAVLEREVGAKLIERSASGASLTRAGAALYDRAKIILSQVDQLSAAITDPGDSALSPVVVGAAPSMMDCLGVALIDDLCRRRPGLRLQVLEEGPPQLDGLLASGGADIIIGPRRSTGADIAAERLFSEPLVLIYSPDAPTPDGADLEALSQLPWVTTRRAHSVRMLIEAIFAQAGFDYRVVAEIDSPQAVIRTVQRGLGVTALPRAVAEQAAALGQVKITPFGKEPVSRPIFMCWRTPAGSAAETVLGAIRDLAAPLGEALGRP